VAVNHLPNKNDERIVEKLWIELDVGVRRDGENSLMTAVEEVAPFPVTVALRAASQAVHQGRL
jgi:hypothetical protein